MENRIIVKKAMRVDSTGKIPASRVLGAFVCFLLFALGVAMILVGLLDPEYSTFALGGLVAAAVGVGFFARYYTLIRQGRVEAIITEEGIAVRKSGFTVIPWANIIEIGVESRELNRELANHVGRRMTTQTDGNVQTAWVIIKFLDENGNVDFETFSIYFTNFAAGDEDILGAINKFRDRLNQADISPDSTDTTTK